MLRWLSVARRFRERWYCLCRSNFPSCFHIYTNPLRGGGGPPLPKDAVSAAWTELLWGSDQLWSPHFPSTIVGPDFSVPRDYFQIGITSASQIRCIFLKEKKQNSKLYSLVVTTPPQKTANWEGSLCILCRRGKGGNERQRKESARLQHPQHPRLDCHIAATLLPLLWDLPHVQRPAHSSAEF